MLTNIADMAEELIGEALSREVLPGEDVFWSVTVLPGQGSTQGFLTINMKGAVIGSLIQSGVFMENPALMTEQDATILAQKALISLRAARSEQLEQGSPERTEAVTASHPGAVLLG